MSLIGEFFNVATGGVVTGLLGNVITTFSNIKMQKLKNDHDINMIKAETESMVAETNANIKITETKVQGDLQISENEIYKETILQSGKKELSNEILSKLFDSIWTRWFGVIIVFMLGIVDFLKAFIRPGVTIYFVAVTTWITLMAYHILTINENLISANEAMLLFKQVINIVIYLTVSCVTWWFGDRRTAKFLYRLNDGNIREK